MERRDEQDQIGQTPGDKHREQGHIPRPEPHATDCRARLGR
jgi:hypothetical protein